MLPFCHCLSFCQNYIKIQDCIDLGFLILLPRMFILQFFIFKDTKKEKKGIPKRINLLIKKSLKNHTFGSSERIPLLSAVLPTNKNTHPPIRKPPPSQANFFSWLPFCHCFSFCKNYIKIQDCIDLGFLILPPKDVYCLILDLEVTKKEEKRHPQKDQSFN